MKEFLILLLFFGLASCNNWERSRGKYLISQKIDEKSLRNSFPDAEIIRRGRDEITFIVESKNLLKFGFKSSTDTDFVIRDLEALVKAESKQLAGRKVFGSRDDPATIDLETYHNLSEIHDYLRAVAQKHPSTASVFSIGKSFENRDILGIKVTNSGNSRISKKPIFFQSLIHAREWITGATTLKYIYELVETDKYAALLDAYEFYIIPVLNVDGYQYTWDTDREWRKSRSGPLAGGAFGVDLNRNFGWKWDDPGNQGESSDSETYSGPHAFSEIEDRNLRDFVRKIKPFFFMDIHSFSDIFFLPCGVSQTSSYEKYLQVGKVFVNATSEAGDEIYQYCEPEKCMYPVTGDTMDYFFYQQNIPFSFAAEIGAPSDGDFEVPPEKIKPLSDQFIAGLVAVFSFLK